MSLRGSRLFSLLTVAVVFTSWAHARTPNVSAPAEVEEQARTFLKENPVKGGPSAESRAYRQYIASFFWGFTNPTGYLMEGADLARAATTAGQEYRKTHSDKMQEVMEGFGFSSMERKGTYTGGMEHRGFRPDDQPDEEWWISSLGGSASSQLPMLTRENYKGVRLNVVGFLSPPGTYGQLGCYKHEFFAWKITRE